MKDQLMWCCFTVGVEPVRYDYTTLRHLKKDSISVFIKDMGCSWDECKTKWGWDCGKVLLTIEKAK